MPRLASKNRDKVKTERISVVITPVLKDQVEKIAFIQRKTLNELMNDIIKGYVKKHGADLKKYGETFDSEDSATPEK